MTFSGVDRFHSRRSRFVRHYSGLFARVSRKARADYFGLVISTTLSIIFIKPDKQSFVENNSGFPVNEISISYLENESAFLSKLTDLF